MLARNLGIKLFEIPITEAFQVFKAQFKEVFKGLPENETEENMQPRLRAMTLMALSNKFGHLLLTTGNKSELAVGYCTIYGDMAGGGRRVKRFAKKKRCALRSSAKSHNIHSVE